MSGEKTSGISAEVRRAADRFSKRLKAKDPELIEKLAEMKKRKNFTVVPSGLHNDPVLKMARFHPVLKRQGLVCSFIFTWRLSHGGEGGKLPLFLLYWKILHLSHIRIHLCHLYHFLRRRTRLRRAILASSL